MPDPDFEAFKQCCRIQGNLDLEVWDVALFEPLKDLIRWGTTQSSALLKYLTAVSGVSTDALKAFLTSILALVDKSLASRFAVLLGAVLSGLAFGTFLHITGVCAGIIPA